MREISLKESLFYFLTQHDFSPLTRERASNQLFNPMSIVGIHIFQNYIKIMQFLLDEPEYILYNVFRILSFFKHLRDNQRIKGTIQK
jgi:hypothetical protein